MKQAKYGVAIIIGIVLIVLAWTTNINIKWVQVVMSIVGGLIMVAAVGSKLDDTREANEPRNLDAYSLDGVEDYREYIKSSYTPRNKKATNAITPDPYSIEESKDYTDTLKNPFAITD